MPELDPKTVAEWFRMQAKKCQDQAEQFKEMAAAAEKAGFMYWGTTPGPGQPSIAALNGSVTYEQVETRIKMKSGRVHDFAKIFNVSDKVILDLIRKPESKVYIADRGWLKVKESLVT